MGMSRTEAPVAHCRRASGDYTVVPCRSANAIDFAAMPADPPFFYRQHVFCCTNTRPPGHPRGCCAEKGSEKLRNYMKVRVKELGLANVRVNAAGCLDRCEFGATMVIYPEGVWYGYRSTADIDEIVETHLVGGGRVARLMLTPEQKKPGD
jgi:(2Fe-2S) ferredoxin